MKTSCLALAAMALCGAVVLGTAGAPESSADEDVVHRDLLEAVEYRYRVAAKWIDATDGDEPTVHEAVVTFGIERAGAERLNITVRGIDNIKGFPDMERGGDGGPDLPITVAVTRREQEEGWAAPGVWFVDVDRAKSVLRNERTGYAVGLIIENALPMVSPELPEEFTANVGYVWGEAPPENEFHSGPPLTQFRIVQRREDVVMIRGERLVDRTTTSRDRNVSDLAWHIQSIAFCTREGRGLTGHKRLVFRRSMDRGQGERAGYQTKEVSVIALD